MNAEADVFIGNKVTKEVHHSNFQNRNCQMGEIKEPIVFESLADARRQEFDLCHWCFQSKR